MDERADSAAAAASSPAVELALRIERAHESFITAMYGGESLELDGARLTLNRWLDDWQWSHGWGLTSDPVGLERGLPAIRAALAGAGRRVAISSASLATPAAVASRLAELGWREELGFTILIAPSTLADEPPEWPGSAAVEGVDRDAIEEFAELFDQVFCGPGSDSPGVSYGRAFARGVARPTPGVEVEHTLVRIDGAPAAVATRAQSGDLAGLYNVAVLEPYRRLGLATALKRYRTARALAAGARLIFETVEDPAVEASELRRGFRKAFDLVGRLAP